VLPYGEKLPGVKGRSRPKGRKEEGEPKEGVERKKVRHEPSCFPGHLMRSTCTPTRGKGRKRGKRRVEKSKRERERERKGQRKEWRGTSGASRQISRKEVQARARIRLRDRATLGGRSAFNLKCGDALNDTIERADK